MLSNLRDTIKNSLIYGLGNLSIKLVGLVLLPYYTNEKYLSMSEYGALGIVEATSQVLIAVFGLTLYQGLTRWYWDKNYTARQNSIYYTLLFFSVIVTILMIVGLYPFSSMFSQLIFDTVSYEYVIKLMLIGSALQIIGQFPSSLLKLQSKSGLYSITNLAKLIIILVFTLLLLIHYKRGIEGIFEAQVLGSLSYLLILLPYNIKNISIKFETQILFRIITYSYPLMLASISGVVLTTLDRYTINFMTNLPEVGIYSAGFKITNTIKVLIINSVQMALAPLLYKKMHDSDSKRFYSKVMTYFSFGLMFVVLFFSLFSSEIINVFTVDKNYLLAIPIMPVIALALFFGMLKDTAIIGLHIKMDSKTIGRIMVLIVVINFVLNIVLIKLFGFIGAAYATLVSQFLFFIVVYKKAQQVFNIPYEIKKIIIIILSGMVLYMPVLFLGELTLWVRILIKFSLIGMFPFLLYFLDFYEDIELKRLKGIWTKWKNLSEFWNNVKSIKESNRES